MAPAAIRDRQSIVSLLRSDPSLLSALHECYGASSLTGRGAVFRCVLPPEAGTESRIGPCAASSSPSPRPSLCTEEPPTWSERPSGSCPCRPPPRAALPGPVWAFGTCWRCIRPPSPSVGGEGRSAKGGGEETVASISPSHAVAPVWAPQVGSLTPSHPSPTRPARPWTRCSAFPWRGWWLHWRAFRPWWRRCVDDPLV